MIIEHVDKCMAGRAAFFEGRWRLPCLYEAQHIIAARGFPSLVQLCNKHFEEALRLGYVSEPFIDQDEFYRRRKEDGF